MLFQTAKSDLDAVFLVTLHLFQLAEVVDLIAARHGRRAGFSELFLFDFDDLGVAVVTAIGSIVIAGASSTH